MGDVDKLQRIRVVSRSALVDRVGSPIVGENVNVIPMAADQPSINLAQATQLIAYEFFLAALALRNQETAGA